MIRTAKKADIGNLESIYNKIKLDRAKLNNPAYEAEVQKKGFLLGTDAPHSLDEELLHAYSLLVKEHEGKIIGYLIADHRDEQKFYDDKYKTWFDLTLKQAYYNDPHGMTIATIATDSDYMRKGVATELLRRLEEKLMKDSFRFLFSIVTLTPLTNTPSIIWHTKNGFRRLAMGRPRKLFQLDNYSAMLLYKKLY